MASFDALGAFSVRETEPAAASRPFDRDRDGLVPSGGAASLVLESHSSAIARGAPIIGEIVGYGFSSNGEHISLPNIGGQTRAMELALKDAGCRADEIDYVNAHATSTPAGDSLEAKSLYTLFGPSGPSITSTKALTGHECWMAGASEVVYSLLMMQDSFIAPNINLENPDEDAAKLRIVTRTTEKNINTFLSNSFGFGGTNSAIVVRKYSGTS
jgi:3-oxoacyl-[acyl-carrier-protein] synthase-1